jgi:hypothetical protein
VPKVIEDLTDEQRAMLPAHREAWTKIGLSTERADRPRFVRAAQMHYEASGLPPLPEEQVVWVENHIELSLAAPIAADVLERLGASTVADSVARSVLQSNSELLCSKAPKSLQAHWPAAFMALEQAVLRGKLPPASGTPETAGGQFAALMSEVVAAAPTTWRNRWYRYIGGQLWVGWYWGPAYTSFLIDKCGLELEPKTALAARASIEQAQAVCWWWPHDRFIVACERPHTISRDERGRLHSASGPSTAWKGFGVYHWHGVRVPAWIIEQPESITTEKIDKETNTEIRRVMIDRYGAARYLQDGGAVRIADDEYGTLWRKAQSNGEAIVMVEVKNSTPEPEGTRKTYFLRVHPDLCPLLGEDQNGRPRFGPTQALTPRNAIASTFGLRGEDYLPEAQT